MARDAAFPPAPQAVFEQHRYAHTVRRGDRLGASEPVEACTGHSPERGPGAQARFASGRPGGDLAAIRAKRGEKRYRRVTPMSETRPARFAVEITASARIIQEGAHA